MTCKTYKSLKPKRLKHTSSSTGKAKDNAIATLSNSAVAVLCNLNPVSSHAHVESTSTFTPSYSKSTASESISNLYTVVPPSKGLDLSII